MPVKYKLRVAVLVGTVMLTGTAMAEETEDLTRCFPAKKLTKMTQKFDSIKPEKRDTLKADVQFMFLKDDDHVLPERFYAKHEDKEWPFDVNADGEVQNLDLIKTVPKNSELCVQRRADVPEGKGGISVNMNIVFKNQSGTHTIEELRDGVKDGRTFYKKMMPGPMALMVPKMSHILVESLDKDSPRTLRFYKDGVPLDGVPLDVLGAQSTLMALSDLDALGVTRIEVSGGAYTLTPTPDRKTLEKFGMVGESEDDTKP